MLLIAIFETNLIILSFRGTAQLFNHFSFTFLDKINLISTNLLFFLFFVYAFAFYFLLTKYEETKYDAYLCDKKCISTSFTLQAFLFGVKNILSGMIHFIFLDMITVFAFLLALKAGLIIVCYKYRKCYKSQISFFLVILYYLIGVIFDGYLIWNQIQLQANNSNAYDLNIITIIEQICLFGFIILILLKILYDTAFSIK